MVAGRYVFTALACLGNMMTLLGRDSLRIAVLAMPDISPEQRSHVLGGYSYGMVVTMVAGGPLADTLGGKWLLAAVVLLSAACTAMVPLLADTTAAGLVACQVVAGLSGGLTVPALGRYCQLFYKVKMYATLSINPDSGPCCGPWRSLVSAIFYYLMLQIYNNRFSIQHIV